MLHLITNSWKAANKCPAPRPGNPPCVSLLHGTQLHANDELCLGRHVLKDISLEPPKHMWPQQIMQFFNLVFFGYVCKLLQEALQVARSQEEILTAVTFFASDFKLYSSLQMNPLPTYFSPSPSHFCRLPHRVTYLNLSGVRKFSRWKSSSRLFCNGVPVSSNL